MYNIIKKKNEKYLTENLLESYELYFNYTQDEYFKKSIVVTLYVEGIILDDNYFVYLSDNMNITEDDEDE